MPLLAAAALEPIERRTAGQRCRIAIA